MDRTSRRPWASNGSGRPQQPCRNFLQDGTCQYGDNCRFRHSTKDSNAGHGTTRSGKESQEPRQEDDLKEWKRLLKPARNASRSDSHPSLDSCRRFFRLARQLADEDIGACQETVRLMAQDEGLSYIRHLVDNQISGVSGKGSMLALFTEQIQPLFELLIHPRVIDSNVLEQEVAGLYHFLQGIDGNRMKEVFDFIATLIEANPKWSTKPGMSSMVVLELSVTVLAKMIDCITSNIINDNFKLVSNRFQGLFETFKLQSDDFSRRQAQKSLQYVQRRLGIGESLENAQLAAPDRANRAQFYLRRDLPGHLSTDGPRHDNDHVNIADISIMPTFDEIMSVRSEYLPTNDPSLFHRPGIQGRLDREFRLLREDTVGQLRDAVRAHLDAMKHQADLPPRRQANTMRTYTYQNATLQSMAFDERNGFDLLVQFPQAAPAKEGRKRQDWWSHSKRFQPGGLVCAISGDGSLFFCVVAQTTILADESQGRVSSSADHGPEAKKASLANDQTSSFVHLNIVEAGSETLTRMLHWFQAGMHVNTTRTLVEFPGVLLPSFQHTLESIQQMSKKPDIPFVDLLAPSPQEEGLVECPPPAYSTKPAFRFDLACLTKDKRPLRCSLVEPLSATDLANHSQLDETQSTALLNSLSRSLALIQGPPGTGKSFTGEKIIQMLLANKSKAELGPILCVCYTNHALDQGLEHLLHAGVKQIIRIGSRSKSTELENLNLRVVARTAQRTKSEKRSLWELTETLKAHTEHMSEFVRQWQSHRSEKLLRSHLEEFHPKHHQAFFGMDEEGYQMVQTNRGQLIEQWLHGGRVGESSPRSVNDLMNENPWMMNRHERERIFEFWIDEIQASILDDVLKEHNEYVETKKRRDLVSCDVDLRCLSSADVVGVTTTGLARNIAMLRKLRCKVVLVEEAGEVLEAHLLTALLPSIEHAILIGDHLQLRPQIQNWDLQSNNPQGSQYSLDVSLFERLVHPPHASDIRLPYSTLRTQRRMHPSIATLVRNTLYSDLEDGGHVFSYPLVKGMKKRLFWFHHTQPEDKSAYQDVTTTSHTNSFEIEMTTALVQHIVRQGSYGPDDIAVITPYLGQLFHLRKRMERQFEITVGERDVEALELAEASNMENEDGVPPAPVSSTTKKTTLLKSVRLATVDNFQGEEAKVVIISLVRSNEKRRCGFLSTPNRINVLLSRAQHGMYLIGNSDTYSGVEMWSKVIRMLESQNNIGDRLPLQCPRHLDADIQVSCPDDFLRFSPEGGCSLPCDRRLPCGHPCINRCHSEVLHDAVQCLEPCPRLKRGCSHPCRLSCGQACLPKCFEKLTNLAIQLPCGHRLSSAFCWEVQDPANIKLIKCHEMVRRTVPGCEHIVTEECHVKIDEDYSCNSRCGAPQPCGHPCKSFCFSCRKTEDGVVRENHATCRQLCNRKYTTCRHSCKKTCHGSETCPPCDESCEVRCSHSKCSKKCHEPCAPCAKQDCLSGCPHGQCTMPCAAPCNWVPCSRRCDKLLVCGHQCPSLCGETCPDAKFCQICGSEDVKAIMVDFIMGQEYREVDLDEDPCIFADCGHFFTMTNMDGIIDMKKHYELSPEGKPTAIAVSSQPFSMEEVKICPTCRGSLRNIARYGRIVRRALLDEATKKFITWCNHRSLDLAYKVDQMQDSLSKASLPKALPAATRPGKLVIARGRKKQLFLLRDWIQNERYKDAIKLWNQINESTNKVRREEQPFQRVADFVQLAARQSSKQAGGMTFDFDESVIVVQGYLQSSLLQVKCELTVLRDFLEVQKEMRSSRPEIELDLSEFIKNAESLVSQAHSSKHTRHELEANIYCAQLYLVTRSLDSQLKTESEKDSSTAVQTSNDEGITSKHESLTAGAESHLSAARRILADMHSDSASRLQVEAELEATETMLRRGVFYAPVSLKERREVYRAMASEFSGTGHWYTCSNGHPFSVGECGMPMEQTRCPECGAAVGGTNHRNAEGVGRAEEMEGLGASMDRLRV